MTNEQLAQHVFAQQQQLAALSSLITTLNETNKKQIQVTLEMQQQILGIGAALQVFAELVMAADPAIKEFVGAATTQILGRPEVRANDTLQQQLQSLQKAATSAPRTTPEGRRSNFQVIPGGEPEGEP